jgi:DnaA family protein
VARRARRDLSDAVGQLPLQLTLADHASFETFVAGANSTAVEHVRSAAHGAADTVWLWGALGAGKSHLLQAACRAASARGRRAMYVALPADSPAVLVDLEQVDLLALDDIDSVAGDLQWERPLFGILNAYLARSGSLLLAASAPATQCGFRLADLQSRGAGAVTYRLAPLDDAGRSAALQLHAAARGLTLDAAAAEFLLKRVARDMPALTAWLAELDRASLTEQRRLTIPFIRELMARAEPGTASAGEPQRN